MLCTYQSCISVLSCRRTTTPKVVYTTSAASAAHEPLPEAIVQIILQSYDEFEWAGSSDALASWLNARWKKSGYSVSNAVVCYTLRSNGRDAKMGLGDHLGGAFFRRRSDGSDESEVSL